MAAQAAKVLRVGVIRNGKIVEERVLPGRPVVTIGTSPKSTLVIPGAQLPATVPLFGWHGEKCLLSFGSDTQGRINGPQGEADLHALVAQGLAAKQGTGYVVPIREDQRGKLMLGDVTILWQFVTPAPEAPRPAIASVKKGNHFQSMDRLFVSMLLLSFVIHSGFYAALAAVPVKQQDATLEEIPDRYARVLIPEKREPPKVPEKASEAVTTEVKVETPAETKKEPEKGKKGEPGPDSPEHKAAHAAAVAKAVQSKGILKVLGALGPGTGGKGAVADVFGSGGGTGDVATALAGAGGVTVAAGGDAGMGQRKGGGQGGAASIGSLATAGGGGGKVGYGAKAEVKVTGSVAAETAEIDSSEVDQAKLGAFVRARMSLLKACYENALKRNPGLKGRMRIRFTILETGGLQDVSTVENALGSEVSSCVVNAMRGWRLPFRPSGPVTVDYPLVFTPGG